ncbi:alpha/beta fold hydrolase [Cellulosimicrobium sp. CUA-896]|uniref:alpha/beta fold hydrolase n=1 Tax=Cellulosimicrobium sp. CUA-896 TaxID=1517881 RepID=UPI000964B240|nr:alpha/beta hydrolase [Cellulosimicrobium sp. CUA-896]OLT46134.1 alpha/beta hydrolase [Cellulosimicrobium sp. CUA-896]
MSTTTPVVVLVHGAFAESSSWDGVVTHLRRRGVEVIAAANPLRSLAGDAAYVRDVVTSVGRPVVLVGHSYGGSVITEAASRSELVAGLVYVAAFAPETGESALELSNSEPGSTLGDAIVRRELAGGGAELFVRPELYPEQFAADVPRAAAELMAVSQRPAAEGALADGLPTGRPAWMTIPSWSVFGTADRNIPPAVLRAGAARAGARTVREIDGASHAIAVSHPQEVAEVVLLAVDAARSARGAVA